MATPQQRTSQGEIVVEYLEKYGNSMMKLTLARLIYKEHPEAFNNIDNVRSTIRYYCGAKGSEKLDGLMDRRFVGACQPETSAEEREDFILPTTSTNCLLISDLHVPYHDKNAIDAALDWGKEKRINTIIINGDFMDFYNLSKYMKDPRQRDLRYELDCGYEMMYYIANKLHNVKIYFLPANHEIRLEAYLALKAPELWGAEPGLCDLDFYLKFSDFGVTYLKRSQIIRAGKLFIGHGDEWKGGSGGVNPARTFFLRAYANFIGGHFHQTSEGSTRELDGQVKTCWSMGCLCGLNAPYMPYNKWNHGFANVRLTDGTFRVFNANIENGRVL